MTLDSTAAILKFRCNCGEFYALGGLYFFGLFTPLPLHLESLFFLLSFCIFSGVISFLSSLAIFIRCASYELPQIPCIRQDNSNQ